MNIYDIWLSCLDINNLNKIKLLEKFNTSKVIWDLKKDDLLEIELSDGKINSKVI